MYVQYFCGYCVVEKKSTNFQCGEGGLVLLTALLCRTVVEKWFTLFSVLCYSGEPENVPLNPNSDLSISSTYLNIFNKSKFSTTCSHRVWCNCLVGAIIGCGAVTECVAIMVWCCHRVEWLSWLHNHAYCQILRNTNSSVGYCIRATDMFVCFTENI